MVTLGVAGLLVLGACSSSDEQGSVPLAANPTTTSTTTAPAAPSTTAAPNVSTTGAPAARGPAITAAPVPAPAPGRAVYVDGVPQVTASPSRASVGTRVRIEGHGFTDGQWRQPGASLWLSATEASCHLVAAADHSVQVSAAGHLVGDFTVPASGECRQSDIGEMALTGGRYKIAFQCTACFVGDLEVPAPATPVSARCDNVVFGANGENAASDIVAIGVSCAEAEALVAEVGGPLGPVNGLPQAEADGWTCVRTGESDRYLPSATYECGRDGDAFISFVRT